MVERTRRCQTHLNQADWSTPASASYETSTASCCSDWLPGTASEQQQVAGAAAAAAAAGGQDSRCCCCSLDVGSLH